MRLDISDLLKKKCAEVNFDESYDVGILKRKDYEDETYELKLAGPLKISGRVINEGEIVQVSGGFSVSVEVECSRCLGEFIQKFEIEFDENFSRTVEEESEYYPIVEGDLVFDDMVMDQIILSMPVRFICNEECKGLCHECGADLNKVDCDCEKETINPKFAALKDLFKQDEEV